VGIFGDNLLGLLVLAVGAAMVVGNLGALIRPPTERREAADLDRAPVVRSVVMAVLGGIASIWALVSLTQ